MTLYAIKDCVASDFVGFFVAPNKMTALRSAIQSMAGNEDKIDYSAFRLFEVGELDEIGNALVGLNVPDFSFTCVCRMSDCKAEFDSMSEDL